MGVSRTMPNFKQDSISRGRLYLAYAYFMNGPTISVVLGILSARLYYYRCYLTSLQSEEEKNSEQAANLKEVSSIL